jgi:serine/threonine-protein kinase
MAGPATTIGRYHVVREIGRGAMGVVYEARDPALDRTVALKVIRPTEEDAGARTAFEDRFLAEARIAAALQHPGIVVVHDVGRDPDTGALFIALERLRGRTLAELVAAGPLDWHAVLRLVAQVARALHHAHLAGVVHRDVKPANVLVLDSGEAKVMDFGIARLGSARQRLTTTGEFIGTPLYSAPEQARTEDVDARADVFSLASVAYTLLAGHPAFAAPSVPAIVHRVVYEDPEPVSHFVPGLPGDVQRVLGRALAKDPADRYPTAEALAEDAEDVLAGRPPRHLAAEELVVVAEPEDPSATVPVEKVAPPARPRSRRAVLLAAVAVVLGLVAFLLWRSPGRPVAPSGNAPAPKPPAAAAPAGTPAAATGTPAVAAGRLRIDFDHPLRTGTLRVFVDDEAALEERLSGQQKKKALVFPLHEGSFRDELEVAAGLHEIRVEIRWEDNMKTGRIVGNFRPGATRRLQATLGRVRRDLSLEWK